MDLEEEIVVVESVDDVDGPLACEDVGTNNLDMDNMRQTLCNSLENEVLQLTIIQVQVPFWKPHH
jgi:hypothetical protein